MTKNFFDDQEEPLTPMAAPYQSGKTDKIIIINKTRKTTLALIALTAAVLIAVYFFIKMIRNPKNYDNNYEYQEKNQVIENTFIDIDPFVVNLSPTDNKQSFLKTTITIHFASLADTKNAEIKAPFIIDSLQTFLRELRVTDFNSTGSTLLLKEELLKRVNKVLYPITAKEILIKELLVN